ncbi:MAG: AMP-binding protein [Acetobacteraceae bacterium]
MTRLPLLAAPRPGSTFARRVDGPVTVETFLGDVAALAAQLPPCRHVVNLCRDRYRFAVGFAAALCRRQVNLLPPHDAPDMLEQLAIDYPDLYCLTDTAAPAGRASFEYPSALLHAATQHAMPRFAADQPAVVLFTSGSTGLGTVPHQHSYGLESVLMLALQHGLVLHAERPFFPADVVAALAAAPHPRLLVTTPVHLRILLAQPGELPQLAMLLSATAPLSASLAREAEVRFAAPLYEIYGCSEAGQIAARRTAQNEEWRCLAGITLRQDAAGTWASGIPIAVETLLSDAIELRNPEQFLLLGRIADLVNIAGKRASLAHLNHHLNAIDGVLDGAFVATDDDGDTVSRLVAFAVAPGLSVDAILTELRQRIDAAFLPRPLHLVPALPRNTLGKLPRDEIARLLAESARGSAVRG